MLVLARRVGEKLFFVVDGKIEMVLTVCKIDGNNVRVGIDAPKEVKVLRSELAGDVLDLAEIKRVNSRLGKRA